MWVVVICFMCRHCYTVICSLMLCERLLYFSFVVPLNQLYIAQYCMSSYYIFHVSIEVCTRIQLRKILHCTMVNISYILQLNSNLHCILSTHCACSLYESHKKIGLFLKDCHTLQFLSEILMSL